MSAKHDLERSIADYYESEAAPAAPEWVLREALATIDVTPQRRVLIRVPWRLATMKTDTTSATSADQDKAHAQGQGLTWRPASLPRALPILLATALLLAGLVGLALVAGGGSSPHDPDEVLTQRGFVEPFIGLPPEGATPSTPQTGELVLSVYGRMDITEDVHGIWLYADGRLIWRRSLDAHVTAEARHRGFGASEPTTAVIEQRLTPEGVELLRAEALSALSSIDPSLDCYFGPALWDTMSVRTDEALVRDICPAPEAAGHLADFASWLPASAWADQRLGGYVPSWYAVCVWSTVEPAEASGIEELLPRPTINLLRSRGAPMADADRPEYAGWRPESCYRVAAEDARAIRTTLDDAGLQRSAERRQLAYEFDDDQVAAHKGVVDFYPILPDGDTVEYGQ